MSNRLTFSLASLIFLIAFGLMFAPVSVLAHDLVADDTDDPATIGLQHVAGTTLTQTEHDAEHMPAPTVSSKLVDITVDKKSTVNDTTVQLVTDADNSPALVTTNVSGEFVVKITFSKVLYTSIASDASLFSLQNSGLSVTAAAQSASTNDLYSSGSAANDVVTVSISPDNPTTTAVESNNGKDFYATFTVGLSLFGGQTGETVDLPIDVRIIVNKDIGYVKTGLVNLINTYGTPNKESSPYKLTIVRTLDEDPPVETITADAKTANKFKIVFDEELKSGSFTVADLDIMNGSATAADLVETPATDTEEAYYTLTVTPDASYELVTVQLKANSVQDLLGNNGPATPKAAAVSLDKIGPAVRFETAPTAGSGGRLGHQMANGPPQLESDGTAKFKITFTEELGSGKDGLERHDLKITGGTAAPADISGPATTTDDSQVDDVYTLSVTPAVDTDDIVPGLNPSPADITVEFDLPVAGPQVRDTADNDIDLATAARYMKPMKGTKSATFDRTPPLGTVTLQSGPNASDKLVFRAVFSEAVRDPSVFDRSATANLKMEVGDGVTPVGTDGTTYDIQVTSADLTKPTTLLFPAASVSSVQDLAGHALAADASATYTPKGTAPKFKKAADDPLITTVNKVDVVLVPELCVTDTLVYTVTTPDTQKPAVELPLAVDSEGDELTYELIAPDGKTVVPNAPTSASFYWETTDTQRRYLLGTATTADVPIPPAKYVIYTWKVTDPANNTASLPVYVKAKALQVPSKPVLTAEKVDAATTIAPTRNSLKLTWTGPGSRAYPSCIAPIMGYTVTQTKLNPLTGKFVNDGKYEAPKITASDTSYVIPGSELPNGIYQFTITATNSAGSTTSAPAVWDKTGGTRIVTADPPAQPQNSTSPVQVNGNDVTLNWLAIPEASQNGAPVYDDVVGASHPDSAKLTKTRDMYYGTKPDGTAITKDFGGYVVYQIDAVTGQTVARYPALSDADAPMPSMTATLLPLAGSATGNQYYDHPSFKVSDLAPGRYAFRFTAVNIAGESARSATTPVVEILSAPAPVFADGATIPSIVAARGETITARILPEATDADNSADELHYDIEPDVSDIGLEFNEDERKLSGTISGDADLGAVTYTYTVRDRANAAADDAQTATLTFLITVTEKPTITNAAPSFGDYTIDDLKVNEGDRIGMTFGAATDPDGDTLIYSLTFVGVEADGESTGQLPTGLTFNATTRRLSAASVTGAMAGSYTYTATDRATSADDASYAKSASLEFYIEVKTTPTPAPTGDLDATYANGVTTITSGMIAANGFATVGAPSLPDLEEFLSLGGTIGLSDGDTTDDKNSRTVVISEILWGLDLGASAMEQNQWQFIELYNTTGASIDLTGWTLTFTAGRPVPASDIDQVSNRSGAGWNLDKGNSHGQSGRVTGTMASDLTSAVTPVNIISMYRNINYAHVEKNVANRGELVKGIPGGNGSGSWKASQRRSAYNRWIYDSKRAEHWKSTDILTPSSVARTPFIINEVGNGTGDTHDWVEIRNVTTSEHSLKNYHLSYVPGYNNDTSLVNFHDKDIKVPGGGILLLVNTDPRNTDIAAGQNVAVAAADQNLTGVQTRYYVNSNLKLPDNGKFNLILRNAHDKLKASSHFMDVIGGQVVSDATKGTSLWPLVAAGGPHGNVIEGHGRDLKAPYAYIRKNAGGGTGEKHLGRVGYTGVGYDRVATKSDANGGTPGYDNGALKEKIADLSNADVTISEIMLEVGAERQNLPQWIELHNSSLTQGVNTNGWKLHIENYDDVDTALSATITLGAMTIAPNQTILIVTNTTGRISDADHFPSHRVVNLWTTKAHRDALGTAKRTDQVFSSKGFYIELTDKDNKMVDEVGNLDGSRRTRDEPTWDIPMSAEGDEHRSSLIRRYTRGSADDGTTAEGWALARNTSFSYTYSGTYYGDADDYGTPGFRAGGPLPVSLSKFRPERLDDGTIVVRWITESELNNAGFNILRSETKAGEYTKLNTQLIKGQGTTSERTAYEFIDKSAKPNVIYYYQIQDVSLDGKVTPLRVNRLKGYVNAAGKATTTWGELKALQ